MAATLVGVVRGIFAIAIVSIDDVRRGVGAVFELNRGFASVDNTATGVYILTLQDSVNVLDTATVLVQPITDTAARAVYSQTPTQFANSQIQVNLDDGTDEAAAVDLPFGIQVQDVNPV